MITLCKFGSYKDSLHGKKDFVFLDMRRRTRELSCEGVGAFLHPRITFHKSSPYLLAFVVMDFMILTADSAFPFAFGRWGLEMRWWKSQALANKQNSSDA